MRQTKKIMGMVLIGMLVASNTAPVFAAPVSSEKEEVVYIMTDASGNVENVNVVNIFGAGKITDYGNYSKVKMLTSNNAINKEGDKITFTSNDEKIYYQGTLENQQIPWNIDIAYYLDGKRYEPSKLAGKSGALEIRFQVTENKQVKGDFYKNYALQASFTLDTNHAANIKADGATIANVGAKKQLTYTILPGKGIQTTIKANVTDFEMAEVAINGIKLNLNVDIDEKELMDKVGEIMDATKQLNSGVDRLYNGSDKLLTGSGALNQGITSLNSGVNELDHGIVVLQDGVVSMQKALNTLNSKSSEITNGSAKMKGALELIRENLKAVSVTTDDLSKLTASSSAIKKGIGQLYNGIQDLKANISYAQYKKNMEKNGLDIDTVKAGNSSAIQALTSQIKSLRESIAKLENAAGYDQQVSELKAQVETLQTTMQLLIGNNAAIAGTESYFNELSKGAAQLEQGAASLKQSYDTFDQAIVNLVNTLSGLTVKVGQMTDGINLLASSYGELDNGIQAYTDGVAQITASYQQIVDGVSSLATGSHKLLKGTGKLSSGASELYKGVESLCNGASELAEGSGEFYHETSDMDAKVEDEIEGILSTIEGDKTETKSFVSSKNTKVDSVQFVIKTASIKAPKKQEPVAAKEEPLSFWQKFLRLFGVGK